MRRQLRACSRSVCPPPDAEHGTADELRCYIAELLADDREEYARDLVRLHYDAAVRGDLLTVEGERP